MTAARVRRSVAQVGDVDVSVMVAVKRDPADQWNEMLRRSSSERVCVRSSLSRATWSVGSTVVPTDQRVEADHPGQPGVQRAARLDL
jgi:hypothetical protein